MFSQSAPVTTFEIPSPLRTQLLLSISTARLTEITSLAKDTTIVRPTLCIITTINADSTQEDPRINFLTAVKALARCSKPHRAKTPPDEQDVEMTDWNEEIDVSVPSSRNVSTVERPRVEVLVAQTGGTKRHGRVGSGQQETARKAVDEEVWRRREKMALKRAHAVAFTWWPHAKASEEQCGSLLQKNSV